MALRRNSIGTRFEPTRLPPCTRANITGRKKQSRDARQQVGNWYRRQSVSQIGSQLLPPVSLTGHETGVFQPAFRVWPADPWSATFLANRPLRNIYK